MGERRRSETIKNKSSVNERVTSGLKSKREKRDKKGGHDEPTVIFPPDAFAAFDLPDGEKFEPSGDFEKDFVDLCSRVGIPSMSVEARPHRPNSASLVAAESVPSKGKDKEDKKKVAESVELVSVDPENEPPSTYTVVEDKYEYLKPRIQIEKGEEENKQFVKELFVRGWKVDQRIVEILTATMPELDKISTIDLWNAGLDDETLESLANALAPSQSLKNLTLDGNDSTQSQNFHLFMSPTSSVQNLSLKSCKLNDTSAENIGKALLDNKNLLTANLCFNKLTCKGADDIAKGLRMNRSLLSLNLGSNSISNSGAKKLAETLSTFPLTHDEVVARRHLKSKFNPATDSDMGLNETHTQSRMESRSPTALGKSTSRDKKLATAKQGSKGKGTDKGGDKGQIKRGPSNADASKGGKGKKGAAKGERAKTPVQDVEDVYEFKNPLLEKTTDVKGELWIPGNRSLLNLNLSRNKIGEEGMVSLYNSMKYQVEQALEMNRTPSPGLLRLSLQNNQFQAEEPTFLLLQDLMSSRDPMNKSQNEPIHEVEEA